MSDQNPRGANGAPKSDKALLRAGVKLVFAPTFPLREAFGEMHQPFEPATNVEDWSVLNQNQSFLEANHEP